MEEVRLLGVKVNRISIDQLFHAFAGSIANGERMIYPYVNIHALNIAYEFPWYREFLNRCAINYCDGNGVKLVAWLLGRGKLYRHTPPDFIETLCALASERNWRVFFLGAKPASVELAVQKLISKNPNLKIKAHHGFFDKARCSSENQYIIEEINQFQTNILLVGFGMPMQELWISDNLESLNANVILPAGALFDYISGCVPRVPGWMTEHGLEWLGRLIFEPQRLWRRYLIGNPLFFWRIFLHDLLGISPPFRERK